MRTPILYANLMSQYLGHLVLRKIKNSFWHFLHCLLVFSKTVFSAHQQAVIFSVKRFIIMTT